MSNLDCGTDTETKLADALRKLLAAKWCTHEYHVAATASIRALDAYDTARAQPASVAYSEEMGEAANQYHARFKYAHPLPARWSWEELWDAMLAATPQPAKENE